MPLPRSASLSVHKAGHSLQARKKDICRNDISSIRDRCGRIKLCVYAEPFTVVSSTASAVRADCEAGQLTSTGIRDSLTSLSLKLTLSYSALLDSVQHSQIFTTFSFLGW